MMLHRHFEKETDRENITTTEDLTPKKVPEKKEEAPKRRKSTKKD